MAAKSVEIIIIRETMWQSIISDCFTFAMVLALIGIGLWVGSVPMQWVGAIMFFMTGLVKAGLNRKRLTVEQARARLDEIALAQEGEKR